jgi:hypothetical protein
MRSEKRCRYFDQCDAPICPLDEQSLQSGTWYPDEPICRILRFSKLRWIKNQKKIAKIGSYESGFFIKDMLDRRLVIRKGIEGINPNSFDTQKQIRQWLTAHPDRPAPRLTQKQLDSLKRGAERLREMKKDAPKASVS